MPSSDGSVNIYVDMNVSDAEKRFKKLEKDIVSLKETKAIKIAFLQNIYKQLDEIHDNIERSRQALKKMELDPGDPNKLEERAAAIAEQKEYIAQLEKEQQRLTREEEKYSRQLEQTNGLLEAKENLARDAAEAVQRQETRQETSGYEQELSMFERFKARVQEGLESLKIGFTGLGKVAVSALVGAFNAIKSGAKAAFELNLRLLKNVAVNGFGLAKKAASAFVQTLSDIGKISISVGKGILKAVGNLNVFSKVAKSIGPTISRLGKMIQRVFVFSVITSGLRLLREKVSEYLGTNAQLSSSLAQLKGAFLTAFNPILQYVIPILNTLINVMTRVLAVVAQFIATLFGTTAKQAKANAAALEEQADATSGAGKAAKEAGKDLAAFDEINKLDTSTGGGGGNGGGGAGAGIEDAFDFEVDTSMFDSWGEAFLWFLNQIDDGIARLKEAFGRFAVWFNDLNKKLLDMFEFPGVKEKVMEIGDDLADAFNYLVAQIDWNLWGRALGAGLNLALLFLVHALYGFDWLGLGRQLANFINGIASKIDWYEFGRLLWTGFKAGIETLAGFLLGLNMPEIAQSASSIIVGFLNSIYDTLNAVDWAGIGRQITAFFLGIDWDGIAQSANRLISKFFEKLHEFITSVDWGSIAASIIDFFIAIDWSGVGSGASMLVIDFMDALSSIFAKSNWKALGHQIVELFNGIKWARIAQAANNLIDEFFKAAHDFITESKIGEIAAQIINFIAAIDWGRVGEGASRLVADFMNALSDFFTKSDWAGLGQRVTAFVVGIDWSGVAKSASILVKNFFQSLTEFIANINWFAIGQEVSEFLASIDWLGIVHDLFTLIGTVFAAEASFLWGLVKDAWQAVVNWWNEKAFEDGKFVLLGLLDGIVEVIATIGSWIVENVFNPFINGFKSAFGIASPSTVMAEMGRFIIEGLKNGLSGLWEAVSGFFAGAITNIKNTFSPETLKNIGGNMVTGLMNGLSNAKTKVTAWAGGLLNGIKDKLGIHSPSTETDDMGFYLDKGMQQGIEDNESLVLDAFSAILTALGTMNKETVDLMTADFVEFLKYLSTEFTRTWNQTFQTLYSTTYTYIQKVIGQVDALNAKLASIERNIVIRITTIQTTVSGNIAGATTGGASARSIDIPAGVKLGPIPALARGAVIPPNRRFLAELGDNTQENEVVSPVSTMKQAFREAMMEMGFNGNNQQEAVMIVDGEVFGRLSYKLGNREGKRVGVSLVEG